MEQEEDIEESKEKSGSKSKTFDISKINLGPEKVI